MAGFLLKIPNSGLITGDDALEHYYFCMFNSYAVLLLDDETILLSKGKKGNMFGENYYHDSRKLSCCQAA